ncbi:MAG: dTDP-4-dehydrorhamnose reductase [Tepidisphaerales bacterium]
MSADFSRILILGGGGMLAYALRQRLAARHPHAHVVAPARSECDITHLPSLTAAFDAARPTLVFNCAAHTKVDLCEFQRDLAHAVNAVAPGDLARLAADRNADLVHVSTDFVFRGDQPVPYRETDPTGPLSVYGQTKLDGEHRVAAAHPRPVIARTSWLYGPGGPCFPATMVRVARAGKPLSVVADQHGTPTFTFDLADALLDLLATPHRGLFHITNAGHTTWHGFAVETLRLFGLSTDVTPITSDEWLRRTPWSARRPAHSRLDTSKLTAAIGRPMRPWTDALADYHRLSPL